MKVMNVNFNKNTIFAILILTKNIIKKINNK